MKKKEDKPKLYKEEGSMMSDSLNEALRGGVIDWVGKDYDNEVTLMVLSDGRVLGFTPNGVMVYVSKEAYREHGKQITAEILQEEKKLLN